MANDLDLDANNPNNPNIISFNKILENQAKMKASLPNDHAGAIEQVTLIALMSLLTLIILVDSILICMYICLFI